MSLFEWNQRQFTAGWERRQLFGHKGKYNNIHPIRNPSDKGHYGNKYKNAIQSWHDRWHGNDAYQYQSYRTAKRVFDYASNKAVKALKANFRRRKSNISNKHYNSKYWRRVALYGRAARLGKIPVNQANRAVNRMKQHHIKNGLVKAQAAWRAFSARDKFLDRKNALSSAALLSPGFNKLGAIWRRKLSNKKFARRVRLNDTNPYYKGKINTRGINYNTIVTHSGFTNYKEGLRDELIRRGLVHRRFRKPTLRKV